MKSLIHQHLYGFLKNRPYLKWWYFKIVWQHDFLPLYMNIPFSRYRLAVWNCGTSFPGKTRWQKWQDLRITLRQKSTGAWMFTIKQGDHVDPKRCSNHFNPFGISVHRYLNRPAK